MYRIEGVILHWLRLSIIDALRLACHNICTYILCASKQKSSLAFIPRLIIKALNNRHVFACSIRGCESFRMFV